MHSEATYRRLLEISRRKGNGFVLLLDPDKLPAEKIPDTVNRASESGVDILFIGGSYIFMDHFDTFVKRVREAAAELPVIIFPGSVYQISAHADAILFLTLISGRNPEHLIGNQVLAAPIIWKMGLEAISCGYMLIESGRTTSAQFASHSQPIPRNKPEIALAHALAAKFLGLKSIYLEAGSGASHTVPEGMIEMIHENVQIPMFVGGGIRTPEEASRKVSAGADFVVVGNFFEKEGNYALLKEFAGAIHKE